MTTSSLPISATSYSEALRLMRANPGKTVCWDAGNGWRSEGHYDRKQKRNVIALINPRGECV